jgi:hypothetical protein
MYVIEEYKDENDKLHRPHELGPAVIMSDGFQAYYKRGKLHCPVELGPAIIWANGTQVYYEHDKLHRPAELGPAYIMSSGTQEYYEHGLRHRPHELGPAIIESDGTQEYWENDKRHRPHELGPAIIWQNGDKAYYEHGIEKTLKEFQAIYKIQRWFRWQRFYNKHRNLFEKVLGLPANHDSVLGKMYPEGGDIYKETYMSFQRLLNSF